MAARDYFNEILVTFIMAWVFGMGWNKGNITGGYINIWVLNEIFWHQIPHNIPKYVKKYHFSHGQVMYVRTWVTWAAQSSTSLTSSYINGIVFKSGVKLEFVSLRQTSQRLLWRAWRQTGDCTNASFRFTFVIASIIRFNYIHNRFFFEL